MFGIYVTSSDLVDSNILRALVKILTSIKTCSLNLTQVHMHIWRFRAKIFGMIYPLLTAAKFGILYLCVGIVMLVIDDQLFIIGYCR